MIITKEQQEKILVKYVEDKHNADECIGLVDGINATIELINKLTINKNMDNAKLIHQLFVGKVADVIGIEKTTALLKEAKEVFSRPVVVDKGSIKTNKL